MIRQEHMAREHVISSTDVQAQPWRAFDQIDGVRLKLLWTDPLSGSYAGLMEIDPDARIRPHIHRAGEHHLYVLSGSCELAGSERVVGPGAYVHVDVGARHGIERAGLEGCQLLFLYLRTPEAGR